MHEIVPRPHYSGHYTNEGCFTSQYSNYLCAVPGFPLGATGLKAPSAIMLNILGRPSSMDDLPPLLTSTYCVPRASNYLYRKRVSCSGREMGHITIVGLSNFEARSLWPLPVALDDPSIGTYVPLPHPSPFGFCRTTARWNYHGPRLRSSSDDSWFTDRR